MIYVSSSSVRARYISEAIGQIKGHGFLNIELSGGTLPYQDITNDLIKAKEDGVNMLLHNYFPPPSKAFVLNLASLDSEVSTLSLDHTKRALEISQLLGSEKFGVHAGFLINIPVSQIGRRISKQPLFNRDAALDKFATNIESLQKLSDIPLYIENNVVAPFNLENFDGQNPFFLTDSKSYWEIRSRININLLLDVAHLKVSCNALEKDFEDELEQLLPISDYVHISDNDGTKDSNHVFKMNSDLYKSLKKFPLNNKTITLEVYDGLDAVKESFNALHSLI